MRPKNKGRHRGGDIIRRITKRIAKRKRKQLLTLTILAAVFCLSVLYFIFAQGTGAGGGPLKKIKEIREIKEQPTSFAPMIYVNGLEPHDISKRLRPARTAVFTAYNSLPNQTDASPFITAAGTRCRPGVVAANFLPFRTKLKIEGFGKRIFVVEDRTNPRHRHRIDIWFPSYREAMNFGKRKLRYYVVKVPPSA